MIAKQRWLTILSITILLSSMAILVFEIGICLKRYLRRDSKVISTLKSTGEVTFLTFSICPAYHSAYKEKVLQSLGTSKSLYRVGNFTTNSTESPWKIFEQVTYDLTEIVDKLEIRTLDQGVLVNVQNVQWTEKRHMTFGRCYSMDLDEILTALGIEAIAITAKIDTFIYLHHPGQFLNSKSKVFTRKGNKHYIDVSYTITKDSLQDDSGLPCSAEMNMNLDDCIYADLEHTMLEKFGCIVPFLKPPQDLDNLKKQACSNQSHEDLFSFYFHQIRKSQKVKCIRPCTSMDLFLGVLQPGKVDKKHTHDNQSYIMIYLKSTVDVRETILDYTLVSMMAEIGGYTGLLLGISLADLAWFFKYCTQPLELKYYVQIFKEFMSRWW